MNEHWLRRYAIMYRATGTAAFHHKVMLCVHDELPLSKKRIQALCDGKQAYGILSNLKWHFMGFDLVYPFTVDHVDAAGDDDAGPDPDMRGREISPDQKSEQR